MEYIKIGVETLRISKAIENDAIIKYAYGWVDLVTPGGLPLEVVVGIAKDPIMSIFLRVNNLNATEAFLRGRTWYETCSIPISKKHWFAI